MSHELHTQAAKCGVALWVQGGLPAPTLLAAVCPWDIMLVKFVFLIFPVDFEAKERPLAVYSALKLYCLKVAEYSFLAYRC